MCVGIFFMQCPPPFGACGIGNLIENVLNFIMKKMHLYFLFIILSSCSLFENNPDLCVVHEHGYIWSPGMSFPVTWSYYVCYENISTIEVEDVLLAVLVVHVFAVWVEIEVDVLFVLLVESSRLV